MFKSNLKPFSLLFLSSLNAQELINDPTFKKEEATWHLRKSQEYKSIKHQFKKKTFSVETLATSSKRYLVLYNEINLEANKTYQFSAEILSDGQGLIHLMYGSYGNIFGKRKNSNKKERKNKSLGMDVALDSESTNWHKITVIFTAKETPNNQHSFLKIALGDFQGKFSLRKPSIIKLDDHQGDIPAKGKLSLNK